MANKEAKLILTLVDNVTAKAKNIERALGSLTTSTGLLGKNRGNAAQAASSLTGNTSRRNMRGRSGDMLPASAASGYMLTDAARRVYDDAKISNFAEAVGDLTAKERILFDQRAMAENENYALNISQIKEAGFELLRSGLNIEQALASMPNTLNLKIAGDIETGYAADVVTNVMSSMRMAKDTVEQAMESSRKVADALAYGANDSNASVKNLAETFKYASPLATTMGLSLEEMAVQSMILADNGIKASSAGTGLRFAYARVLKPTKEAAKALARLNINMGDYVTGARAMSATELIEQLSFDGINASGLETQIQQALENPDLKNSPLKLTAHLTDLISNALGSEGIVDNKTLSDSLNSSLAVLGTQFDASKFLKAMRDNPRAQAEAMTIFGKNHGAKMIALLTADYDKRLADFEKNYTGSAERMKNTVMKGIVGDVARLAAAYDNLIMTISKTGVMTAATAAIVGLTDGLQSLSALNPQLLEFGTYGLVALTALAPMGFMLTGVASAVGFLGGAIAAVLSPLGLLVAGVSALAYMNWDKIKIFSKGFASGWSDNFDPERIGKISSSFADLKNALSDAFGFTIPESSILLAGENWGKAFALGANAVLDAVNGIIGGLTKMIEYAEKAYDFMSKLSSVGNGPNGATGNRKDRRGKGVSSEKRNEVFGQAQADASKLANTLMNDISSFFNPQIGTGSIDAAITKAHQLQAALNGAGGNVKPVGGRARGGGRNPKKAAGGSVRRGMTYEINEKGRETVTMGTNGYVTPAHKAGGATYNNTFNVTGSNADEIMNKIASIFDTQLSRSNQLALDGRRIR